MSARMERDEALARVEAGTDPHWAMMAEESVATLARSGESFSSDDVWEALSLLQVEAPREPRAMGPVMRRMIVDNVITATGFAISRRRHGGTVRMYGSAVPVIVPEPEPVVKKLKVAPVCELCESGHGDEHHCRYCGRQARLLTRVSSPASSLYEGPKT